MKAFCAWAVVLPLWPCLAEECSDTVGSCSAKQASLMQFKSMSQKKQALSLEAQTSFSSKLAGFQKFTDEMVEKYGQPEETGASAPPTQDVLQAVWTVLDFIEQMHAHLYSAHLQDQVEASGCEDTEADCKDNFMNVNIIHQILFFKRSAANKKEAHRECRANATDSCKQICKPNGNCITYDAARKTDSRAKLPVCVNNPVLEGSVSAFSDGYIRAAEDSQELKAMEECLDDTNDWLDFLYPKYDDCRRVESECEDLVETCDTKQTVFQEAQCLYALDSNLQCQSFNQCKTTKATECQGKCGNIEMRSGARAADDETGQRLVCLLHTLFGAPNPSPSALKAIFDPDNTGLPVPEINKSAVHNFDDRPALKDRPGALDNCKDQEIDTTQWSITCQDQSIDASTQPNPVVDGVPVYDCPIDEVLSPCGEGFAAQAYGGMQNNFNPEGGVCSDLALRGAQKVVNDCAIAGECIGAHSNAREHLGLCKNNLLTKGGTCCPLECGTCGGKGCSGRPGGAGKCCAKRIKNSDKECSNESDDACFLPGYGGEEEEDEEES